jgi:DNA-binding MarR family transcriptional regulator
MPRNRIKADETPVDFGGRDPAGWRPEELDYPTFRLSVVAKMMDRLSIRDLADRAELSLAEWRVVFHLARTDSGFTVGQIADRAWVDRAEVCRAVASLEARKLVTRRSNLIDRRAPILLLTTTGKRVYRSLITARRVFHRRAMASFSPRDAAQLDRLLQALANNLERITEAPRPTAGRAEAGKALPPAVSGHP